MDAVRARAEPRAQFVTLSDNPAIRYLPDSPAALTLAQRMAGIWEDAVHKVEKMHGAAFIEQPKVYVCHADCFVRYTTMSATVPAGHFMDSVFMNEPVLWQRETNLHMAPENFLVHELAHLLLYQHAGGANYMRVPAWFREGLAVALSNGAGAEACSPEEAASALLAGKSFDPAETGSLFANRLAASYGLHYPVFYRQAGMFVSYMMEIDRIAFQEALNGILKQEEFQRSFQEAYGRPIVSYWPEFKQDLKSRQP
jgi:hypothetical protein